MDAMAEVAPHVQDDFDLAEGQLAEVELQDREENLVRAGSGVLARVDHTFRSGSRSLRFLLGSDQRMLGVHARGRSELLQNPI